MVEAPSNRVFVVAISFLAIFATLTSFMPVQFTYGEHNFKTTHYDDFYSSNEIEALATTYVINVTYGGGYYYENWGQDEGFGYSFQFVDYTPVILNATWAMFNSHYEPFWFIIEWHTDVHRMDWTSKLTGESFGEVVTNYEFESVAETSDAGGYNLTMGRFILDCPHLNMHSTVFYNSTAYSNSTEAWENDDIHVEFAIEWDELGTGLNGWNLLSAVLWFQAPDVHPAINFFIAFPMWVDIALIIFKVVMVIISVLPFT